ncbi:MAG: GTPase Era [Sumerlaeia bacterium]
MSRKGRKPGPRKANTNNAGQLNTGDYAQPLHPTEEQPENNSPEKFFAQFPPLDDSPADDAPPLDPNFRCGFVAFLGKPNVGKSTLVNALLGEKLVAVSGLPQTTRDRINAIVSRQKFQVIFVDLPGLVEADDKLNEVLRENVLRGIEGVDCVLHLMDATEEVLITPDMAELLKAIACPVIGVLNKIDQLPQSFKQEEWARKQEAPFNAARYQAFHSIAARQGAGVPELLDSIVEYLPFGPPLYDPEDLTDRDMRFLTTELIREKIFLHTHQELPYSTAVSIDEFSENDFGKWFISATIYVERDAQKGMIIGKKGDKLKQISTEARRDIEALAGTAVYLELFVKTAKHWRKSDFYLKQFGYRKK